MRAAISKAEIESEITSRFGTAFKLHEKTAPQVLATGIAGIDSFLGGLPRGAITEAFGPASSGRTSFMFSALAHATMHDEVCAFVDTNNSFDPKSAKQAEVNFERLLWIRCNNNLEHAFKATDLLLQAGGFGVVMLDLADVPAKSAKKIISSWWYRFRRTLEATQTVLLVIAEESCVRSCAALALELKGEMWVWSSANQNEISQTQNEISQTKRPVKALARGNYLFIASAGEPPPIPRSEQQTRVSHSHLLQGLHLRVECHRPLHMPKTADEILFKVAH